MDKLTLLRQKMTLKNLGALLIPQGDAFQNHSLHGSDKRLEWLTGFTGSAGLAVVTPNKAAFFTDARYLLQGHAELPSAYDLYNIRDLSPSQWVEENLHQDATIGYDPWLFTEIQLHTYKRPLVPLESNPIDEIWDDRPLPPKSPLALHPIAFAGEAEAEKRKRIASALKADHVLITALDSLAWLLNLRGKDVPYTPLWQGALILHKDGSYDLFMDETKLTPEIKSYIKASTGTGHPWENLIPYLKNLEGACQIDPETLSMPLLQALTQGKATLIRSPDPCLLPKALKNATELKGAQDAHLQDGIALCRFLAWLSAQPVAGHLTELTAAQKLESFREAGENYKGPSFPTISAFGPHGAIIHYRATLASALPLKSPGLYLVDSGGQYLTGTTDVTRTVALGAPSPEQKDHYTRVLKGYLAIENGIFPKGTTGSALDSIARQFLWKIGKDYAHATGHGVGSYLNVHEGPQAISSRSTCPLEPGMILSNEPGYYESGEYGIRLESLIYVKELPDFPGFYGFETLTLAPFDPTLIEPSLLTQSEKKYIKAYHHRVLDRVGPYVDPDTHAWLEGITKASL